MDKIKEFLTEFVTQYQQQFTDYATMSAEKYRYLLLQKLGRRHHPLAEAALKGDLRACNMIAELFLNSKTGYDMNKWPLTERLLQPGLQQKDAEAHFWIGMLHAHLRKYCTATAYLIKAFHLGYTAAELPLAEVLFDAGDKEDARDVAYQSVKHTWGRPDPEACELICAIDNLPSYCAHMLEHAFYENDLEAQTYLANYYLRLSTDDTGTWGQRKYAKFWRRKAKATQENPEYPDTTFMKGGPLPTHEDNINF